MLTTIESKIHGMYDVSIKQLTGHGIYYVFLGNSPLHKSFYNIQDAVNHINTYLPVKGYEYYVGLECEVSA
jgi:hypothetical protein